MTDNPTRTEVFIINPETGIPYTGAEVLALNEAAIREQEAKRPSTSQRARIKLVPTDDVEAMKNILESIQEVNEQVPTFDINLHLNQLVDAVLDLPASDYARFGKKIAELFNKVVDIRKESDGEPFLILKAEELGEHVTLEEFRRYEASAELHKKINEVLVKTGVRPTHEIPAMSPKAFSVVRRIIDSKPIETTGPENYDEKKAREIAEFKRLQDLTSAIDLDTPTETPAAMTFEELAGINPGGGAVVGNDVPDVSLRLNNLEQGLRQLHEYNSEQVERQRLERQALNDKLAEILSKVSKEN